MRFSSAREVAAEKKKKVCIIISQKVVNHDITEKKSYI